MSICARIVIAVALHQIDYAPDTKPGSKCYNKGLQNVYCAIEKCHKYILSAASAAVRQADKRRSAYGRRRTKKPPSGTGKGKIAVKPDKIRLYVNKEELCKEYEDTLRRSTEDTELLKDLFEKLGFQRKDLKTVYFNVDTEYESY